MMMSKITEHRVDSNKKVITYRNQQIKNGMFQGLDKQASLNRTLGKMDKMVPQMALLRSHQRIILYLLGPFSG